MDVKICSNFDRKLLEAFSVYLITVKNICDESAYNLCDVIHSCLVVPRVDSQPMRTVVKGNREVPTCIDYHLTGCIPLNGILPTLYTNV